MVWDLQNGRGGCRVVVKTTRARPTILSKCHCGIRKRGPAARSNASIDARRPSMAFNDEAPTLELTLLIRDCP